MDERGHDPGGEDGGAADSRRRTWRSSWRRYSGDDGQGAADRGINSILSLQWVVATGPEHVRCSLWSWMSRTQSGAASETIAQMPFFSAGGSRSHFLTTSAKSSGTSPPEKGTHRAHFFCILLSFSCCGNAQICSEELSAEACIWLSCSEMERLCNDSVRGVSEL